MIARHLGFPSHEACAAAYDVLAYLLEHPAAKDTRRGILEYWVLREPPSNAADVEAALKELVQRGWVVTHGRATTVYGLNGDRVDEIQAFLEEAMDASGGAP